MERADPNFVTLTFIRNMTELEIILRIYRELISKIGSNGIPVDMRAKSIVGTVQDDPFDN